MRDLCAIVPHLVTIVFRLIRPGGVRSVVAEAVVIKHQLLIVNRSRRRAQICESWIVSSPDYVSLWIKPSRLLLLSL
jgi:hypothetical protein